MKLNEQPQVPFSVTGQIRAFLFDILQAHARAINRRVSQDGTQDIIIDDDTKGLVLKDSAGHYWRVTVDTLGALTTTDLGTTKP